MKKLTLYLFALIICNICYAQNNYKEGYIIKNNNDTVYGWINFRSDIANQTECMFLTEKNGKSPETFTPEQLIGYRFTASPSKYYLSKAIDIPDAEKILDTQMARQFLENQKSKQVIFAEYLVSGVIDLYFFSDKTNNIDYYIFEEKGKEPIYIGKIPEVIDARKIYSDKKYIGILTYQFQDYPDIMKEINEGAYNQKTMIKIAKIYDDINCPAGEAKCIVYENTTPDKTWAKIKFSVFGGMQETSYSAVFESGTFTGKQTLPFIGAEAYIYNPRFSETLVLFLNVSIAEKMNAKTQQNKRTVEYKGTPLSAKIGVRYAYSKYRIRPTVEAGLAFTTFLNGTYTMDDRSNYWAPQTEFDYKMRTNHWGLFWGVGVDYRIYKQQYAFIRFNYDSYIKSDQVQDGVSNYPKIWQLKAGYTF